MEGLQLTVKQQEIVKAKGDELLIRGIAGSGKTLVILRKAKQMAEANPRKKIYIFSYNKTLKASAEQQIEQFNLNNLKVMTFHSWAYGMLCHVGKKPNVLKKGRPKQLIIRAISEKAGAKSRFSDEKFIDFVIDEIGWLKGMGFQDRRTYLEVSRKGRGSDVRLSKEDRGTIYDIYERYEQLKGSKKDYNDYAIDLDKSKGMVSNNRKMDTVFVDEAQDLQLIQLRLLREMTLGTFIVAADKGQKIYTSSFTWKDIGLNITGGRTKILDETFRSTKPIVELARSIQRNDVIKKDDEFIECRLPARKGAVPTWYRCHNHSNLIASVLKLVKTIDPRGEKIIGVLSREWWFLDNMEYHFGSSGHYTEKIKYDKGNAHIPGVKLTTYHSAKGLEFDYVIIIGKAPKSKKELDPNIERRLYYVSMTRAKAGLYIFTEKDCPEVLNELDPNLYILKELKDER